VLSGVSVFLVFMAAGDRRYRPEPSKQETERRAFFLAPGADPTPTSPHFSPPPAKVDRPRLWGILLASGIPHG